MAKRKIVFVIVEGPSDEDALGVLFSKIYGEDSVYVHIVHGDITTQKGVTSSNIVSKIGNYVKQYANQKHYKAANFQEIIHIIDMDGAYAPDSVIVKDTEATKAVYDVTEIRTDEEKEKDAYMFAKKYRNDIPGFLTYIKESDFSVGPDYKESWKYITDDLHSLERHTNLGICFSDAKMPESTISY